MATIDMDKTIENALAKYLKHVYKIQNREKARIEKIKDAEIRAKEQKKFDKEIKAAAYLESIAQNPKKYLFSGENIVNQTLSDGSTVYEKLLPVLVSKYDTQHLIMALSQEIAKHSRQLLNDGRDPRKEKWEYVEYSDLTAERILTINKAISLIGANDFVSLFKGFLSSRRFATFESSKDR